MARPLITDEKDIEYAQGLLSGSKNLEDLHMAQAILLPHRQRMSFAQTANLLGVCPRSISRLRHRLQLKRKGEYAGDRRGGRQPENMSLEQEKSFLGQWRQRAASGQIVLACEMRQALAAQLGRRVCESYVYGLLARNHWRKLAPDTRHPKADAQKQEEWKKTPGKTGCPVQARANPRPPA